MKLSHYKFNLPDELIALHPSRNRDESKLMVLHRHSGKIEHKMFKDLKNYFNEDDTMVMNDTKVFPARLYGFKEKTGAQIEVFLLRELNREQRLWDVLVNPARKIRIGNKLYFGENEGLVAEVIDNTTSRGRTLRFLHDSSYAEFKDTLYSLGETPLPKFIKRPVEEEDRQRYQTIYASKEGAVAAPTAGMHFSRELMKRLEIIGVNFSYITLHVGLGNFRPIEVEDLTKHKMDSEEITIPDNTVATVNNSKDKGKHVCCVGTTVLRTLESSKSTDGHLKPYEGWTNLFMFPPYEVEIPTSLITNFHLPKSVQMIMVSSFAGFENLMHAYKVAKEEGYRFGTYGDAMLVI